MTDELSCEFCPNYGIRYPSFPEGVQYMKKIIAPLSAAFMIAGSLGAEAADLRLNRDLVQQAIELSQQTRRSGRNEIQQAGYKLESVRSDIYDLRPSQDKSDLERALDDAVRAVRDYRMPDYQKADIVEDRGFAALEAIDRLLRYDDGRHNGGWGDQSLDDVLFSMDRTVDNVRQGYIREATDDLHTILSELERYSRDADISQAVYSLEMLLRRLEDRYLSSQELLEMTEDSTREARDAILRSNTYRSGGRGDHDGGYDGGVRPQPPRPAPRPPVVAPTPPRDDVNMPRELLGHTASFSASHAVIQTLNPQPAPFREIALVARRSDIRVDFVEIVFGNGRVQRVAGTLLAVNGRLLIGLDGTNGRFIKQIRIKGRSMNARAGEGSISVMGRR